MEVTRGEARATDLDFLPPAGHAAGLAASVLWTFPLAVIDLGGRGDDMHRTLGLGVVVVIAVRGVFSVRRAGGDEGSGRKISERVKKTEGQRRH